MSTGDYSTGYANNLFPSNLYQQLSNSTSLLNQSYAINPDTLQYQIISNQLGVNSSVFSLIKTDPTPRKRKLLVLLA